MPSDNPQRQERGRLRRVFQAGPLITVAVLIIVAAAVVLSRQDDQPAATPAIGAATSWPTPTLICTGCILETSMALTLTQAAIQTATAVSPMPTPPPP